MAVQGDSFTWLGGVWHRNVTILPAVEWMFELPPGVYGIAYDMVVHSMEDKLGDGWAQHRGVPSLIAISFYTCLTSFVASVYREIAKFLRRGGFEREQYSVWQRETSVAQTFAVMATLRSISPRGIFATSVGRLEMFQVPMPNRFIVTEHVRLGGMYSPMLLAPTPASLAGEVGVAPPLDWPTMEGDELPRGVNIDDEESWDPDNWKVQED